MARDNELEWLESQVADLYGYAAAKALETAKHRALDVVNQLPIDLAEDAKPVPLSVFYNALKAELRRLVQPH